jgi:CheY-like chemotaxis protein
LPVDFPELAADRDFVSLLLSLTGSANSEQVRLLLRRRPLTRVPKATLAEQDVVLGEDVDGYRGMRVLWIDDHPDGNWEWMHYLTERGAQVTAATDLSSALEALPRVRPTVLLSDIARGDDLTAGLTDLEYLRSNDIYRGPVIFFVGQVTPSRLRRAEELGATGVTENFGDVLRWLLSIATESGPKSD